jgi:hypothetical protein
MVPSGVIKHGSRVKMAEKFIKHFMVDFPASHV